MSNCVEPFFVLLHFLLFIYLFLCKTLLVNLVVFLYRMESDIVKLA